MIKYCGDRSLLPSVPSDALLGSEIQGDGFEFLRELPATDSDERPSASQALDGSTRLVQVSQMLRHRGDKYLIVPLGVDRQHDPQRLGVQRDGDEGYLGSSMSAINFATDSHAGLKSLAFS